MNATIEKKRTTTASGLFLEAAGFILLFLFPFGTILGICFIIAGVQASKKLVCSMCGSELSSKHVRLCWGCSAKFK